MKSIGIKGLAHGLVAGTALFLAGCGGEAEVAEAPAEGTIPGMTIENARMMLPPVEGNPAAVYFDLSYDGDRGLTIRRADVEGASRAELHDFSEYNMEMTMMEALPIALTKGTELSFEPGARHVMAFELAPELQEGGTAQVTLTVSGGQTHRFDAEIRAAGDER